MRAKCAPRIFPSVRTSNVLKTGHTLNEHMPPGEKGRQGAGHELILTDEDARHFASDVLEGLSQRFDFL